MNSSSIAKRGGGILERILMRHSRRYMGANTGAKVFKNVGAATEKVINATKTTPIFSGIQPPFKKTTGRAQWYYGESLHQVSDNVVYQVRMPLKFAESEKSKKYSDVVDKEILKYLELKLPHNLFDPENGHSLDITVKQLRQMLNAPGKCFEVAASGELKQIVSNHRAAETTLNEARDRAEASLDDAASKLDAYTDETWSMYRAANFEKSGSLADWIPFVGRSKLQLMIEDVSTALAGDSKNQTLLNIAHRVYDIAHSRVKLAEANLKMVSIWNEFHTTTDYDKANYEDSTKSVEKSRSLTIGLTTFFEGGHNAFESTFVKINQDVQSFKTALTNFESARSKRDNFFSSFEKDDEIENTPEKVKDDLLAYLSGAIVLKDHRYRYQQEQYDRYLAFKRWVPILDRMTLRQFSSIYAQSLRNQVDVSHNFLCPQIDANYYDDYEKRSSSPLSSTVFYFFFSANRVRRQFAQVILSAARYPNDKIRRAYMRFFSNA
jgi:hypothetical protein